MSKVDKFHGAASIRGTGSVDAFEGTIKDHVGGLMHDDAVEIPMPNGAPVIIVGTGKEANWKSTSEAPCDENHDQSANKNRMSADGVAKRSGKRKD
jgi:hypothetical protein